MLRDLYIDTLGSRYILNIVDRSFEQQALLFNGKHTTYVLGPTDLQRLAAQNPELREGDEGARREV